MIALASFATILSAHAVTFSIWLEERCPGSPKVIEQKLEPCKCYSIGDATHGSIQGWGLQNTPAKSGDVI